MTDVDELQALEPGDLLADRAYRQLSRAILGSQLPAGTPLSVPELAQRLNISRSPVREAVQRLIYDGLAVSVPHRGAVVSEIKPDDFRAPAGGARRARRAGRPAGHVAGHGRRPPLLARGARRACTRGRLRRRRRQRRARHPVPPHHPGDRRTTTTSARSWDGSRAARTCPASRCGGPSATPATHWLSTARSSTPWPPGMPKEPSRRRGGTSRTSSPESTRRRRVHRCDRPRSPDAGAADR